MSKILILRKIMKDKIVLFFLILLCSFYHVNVHAQQNNGIAEKLSNYVNFKTGNFSYSIPLLTIPGPNGENFPLTASYNAGIKVNQSASWIGLGWDLNIGEITRNVKGIADDWKGKSFTH